MPSTYSPDLRIELMANGANSGTWGTITNTNLGTVLEDSISGLASVVVTDTSNTPSKQALTVQDGAADQARCAVVSLTTTAARNMYVYVPPVTKTYVFINESAYVATIYASTVAGNTTAAGAGVAIPAGGSVLLRCDGTDILEQLNTVAGNFEVVGDLNVIGTFNATGSPTIDANLNVVGSTFLGTSQTASIAVTSPTIITVASSPETGSAVSFSTTGTLPTGITAGTTYYVSKINGTTFFISTSPSLTPLVNVTLAGSGVHTVSTVSLGITSAAGANNTQLSTTSFVNTAITNALATVPVNLTNWAISETSAAQTATITIATPAVVTVTTAPANSTAVAFTTTGALPTGITAGTPYYVFNRTSTTYNLATTLGQAQTATYAAAVASVFNVAAAPTNGQVVYFGTGCPSAITAGTNYYVVNRTSTTFQVSLTSGGSVVAFSGSGSCTATWQSIVATSGSQSGVQTENTSKMYFKYKTVDKMSIDLGGNAIMIGNVTAFGTP